MAGSERITDAHSLWTQIWIMTSQDGICVPDTEIRELPSSVCRYVYSH